MSAGALDRPVRRLLDIGLAQAWSCDKDLPWDARVDPERAGMPGTDGMALSIPT